MNQFIAIHDRRGDFANRCKEGSCLNQLSIFAEQVNEIRRTLFRKHNKNITPVFLASGELYLKSCTLSINRPTKNIL